MKVAWIYPKNSKCGISFYSENYLKYLNKLIEVDTISSSVIFASPKNAAKEANKYDIIHVQYEISHYVKNRYDSYKKFITEIKKPTVVSLHEVYDQFPGAFPRTSIKGLFSPLKKWIYDYRHPYLTSYRKHLNKHFGADKILVHYNFQKEILIQNNLTANQINVIPLPSEQMKQIKIKTSDSQKVSLVSLGFINKNYNYEVLFKTLENLSIPWQFIWLGGLRISEDKELINQLNRNIKSRNWNSKFKISGWLSEEEYIQKITESDIALHLYKDRSSSSSLCKSFAFGLPVISTKLPLTEELHKETDIILINHNNYKECSKAIEDIYLNSDIREKISNREYNYANNHSYSNMARKIVQLYKEILQ